MSQSWIWKYRPLGVEDRIGCGSEKAFVLGDAKNQSMIRLQAERLVIERR